MSAIFNLKLVHAYPVPILYNHSVHWLEVHGVNVSVKTNPLTSELAKLNYLGKSRIRIEFPPRHTTKETFRPNIFPHTQTEFPTNGSLIYILKPRTNQGTYLHENTLTKNFHSTESTSIKRNESHEMHHFRKVAVKKVSSLWTYYS